MPTHTIWIVEDDAAISRSLQTLLVHSGYEARAFLSGSAVLSSLDEIIPDLMLLDLNLPDVDGLDVCRHIRALPVYVPVIMLTARDTPVEVHPTTKNSKSNLMKTAYQPTHGCATE